MVMLPNSHIIMEARCVTKTSRVGIICIVCLIMTSIGINYLLYCCIQEIHINVDMIKKINETRQINPQRRRHVAAPEADDTNTWRPSHDYNHLGPVVNPYPFKYVIEPTGDCSTAGHLLVIYVHSDARNNDRRTAIRNTWGNTSIQNVAFKVFFMLAVVGNERLQAEIREESSRHNDVIQQGFLDDYRSMTYKAIGALQWLHTRCTNTKYFMKTDDDTFVNIFTVLRHLGTLVYHDMGSHGILMCCRGHLKPVLRKGKWAVTRDEFPEDYYPYYCSGMAYILTPDVVSAIYLASAHVPYFWIDDIFITGMLPEAIGLKHVEMKRAFILDISKREELLSGEEWYKFAFCHVPHISQFTRLWDIVHVKGLYASIPDVIDLRPGKLADNYIYPGRSNRSRYYVPPLI